MAFTIPNKDTALADVQSVLFKEHLDILVAGVEGSGITSGCEVTPSAGMVIAVAAGGVIRVGVAAATSAATPTLAAAHATLHRFDTVVIATNNAVAVRQGVAAVAPKPAALTAGDIALAMVLVPAAATSIAVANITDTRIDVPTDKQPLDATLTSLAGGVIAEELTNTATSALQVPAGTSAQRPAGANGKMRYNADLKTFEGYAEGAWGSIGGGAKGGPGNSIFYENDQTVTADYTLTSGKNAMSAGPIEVAAGVTVTVPTGSVWTIV